MKTEFSFNVEFDYALSENISLKLTANAELHNSIPHYHITDFQIKNNPHPYPLLPDIDIMAIKQQSGISWVHTDSMKETILSVAVGKAIEARGGFEIAHDHQ